MKLPPEFHSNSLRSFLFKKNPLSWILKKIITLYDKLIIMAEIFRNRTIRPSSRDESSKSYKIETQKICATDTLIVNIDHEKNRFDKTYKFSGADVADKKSISFRVYDYGTSIEIKWSGAQPIGNISGAKKRPLPKSVNPSKETRKMPVPKFIGVDLKTSFEPIANAETRLLILGTMPGEKSLLLNEYYANSRNYFWKIIAALTNSALPENYQDKIKLLQSNHIGLWDVAHKAIRKGSLDIAIKDEEPNDLDTFISKHKKLKLIGFNGTKSEALYDKYFARKKDLQYLLLPSTSSANTSMSFDNTRKAWKQIFG